MTNNNLINYSVLIIEQGFLREEAFTFLNSNNCKADFFKIEEPKPFKKNIFDKYINIFHRLILKDKNYLVNREFSDKNNQFISQINIRKQYDYILIIRPDNFSEKFIKTISAYSNNKLLGYLWDGISDKKHSAISKIRAYFNEIYCFDKASINKYSALNLSYTTNFYYPIREIEELAQNHIKDKMYKISYVGQLADRRDLQINDILSNISSQIPIVKNINLVSASWADQKTLVTDEGFVYHDSGLSLHDYLRISAQSDIILDIQIDYQQGHTFRIFEQTFYRKKIITTNQNVAQLKLYHPDNIFIYNNETKHLLSEFIEKPYYNINASLIEYYRIDNWLNRVLKIS